MTEQAAEDDDPFSVTNMKAICARLNIPVTTFVNDAGEADLAIDQAGWERIRDSMLLVGEIDLARDLEASIARHLPPDGE
ncbi:hypothetical protein ACIBCU_26285 [Streptomyces sp. NPDC051064]|uniref:hypothetical protein n=1 Tax=Streptomyces sp. NPDC051064 TaxID=3365641 RepID=UPI003795A037